MNTILTCLEMNQLEISQRSSSRIPQINSVGPLESLMDISTLDNGCTLSSSRDVAITQEVVDAVDWAAQTIKTEIDDICRSLKYSIIQVGIKSMDVEETS